MCPFYLEENCPFYTKTVISILWTSAQEEKEEGKKAAKWGRPFLYLYAGCGLHSMINNDSRQSPREVIYNSGACFASMSEGHYSGKDHR